MNFSNSKNRFIRRLSYTIIGIVAIAVLIFSADYVFRNNRDLGDDVIFSSIDNEVSDNEAIEIDSDSDGLLDSEEELIGTDKFKSDTDGDGYLDLAEIENGYNPLGEGEITEELSKVAENIISRRDKRLLVDFMEKYNSLGEYSIEYGVSIASEERSYLGPDGESPYNTKAGEYFIQKTYKKDKNFRTDNQKGRFTFDGNLVNSLKELYVNDQYISCGGLTCHRDNQFNFFEWDWKFFQNPNFFYNYLAGSDYTVKHLGSSTNIAFNEEVARAYYNEDELKKKYYSIEELKELGNKCKGFKVILNEEIYIENISFLDENKSRKAEVDICIDNDTGVIVALSVLAQSDAKGEDKNKLYDIISWNARVGVKSAGSDEIVQKGEYILIGKAWDRNEVVVVIEPYISGFLSGSAKFFDSNGKILEEIKIDEQNFIGQEKKKLIIEHNLNLEKEIKYELCVDSYCKVIEPSIISEDYSCFRNFLEKNNCEEIDGCFYNNNLCLEFDCISVLVKDKKLCEKNGCYWIEEGDGHDRCFDYLCKFHQSESSCNEIEDCLWSNSFCIDKECHFYEKKETCESSNLKCTWNGFRCEDFSCLRVDNENECVINNECVWKAKESENEGTCKDVNKIEGNLPNCPNLKEDNCVAEELCSWKESKCSYNICGIHSSKSGCKVDEKCYWEPYSSCVNG